MAEDWDAMAEVYCSHDQETGPCQECDDPERIRDQEANPWQELQGLDEQAYVGGEYTSKKAREAVAGEYRDSGQFTRDCPCGGTLHYRATVGCLKCPRCGQLAHTNGELF